MVTRATGLLFLVFLAISGAGCEVIGGIFKAGMWTGVIAVVLILVLVGFIASKIRR